MRKILGWAIMAPHWNRSAAFWFVYFAPFLFVLGMLLAWLAQKNLPWPRFLGWTLMGIWLLVPISFLLVRPAEVRS